MVRLFLYAALFTVVRCQQFSRALIEANQRRYGAHEQCLRRRDSEFERFGDQLRFKTAKAVRGGEIKLNCFTCLHPEHQKIIEDIWKPNGASFGRRVDAALDSLKRLIRKHLDWEAPEVPNISWEFMPLRPNATFRPVLDLAEPLSITRRFAKAIRDLFNPSLPFRIGDLFELEILEANVSDTGWYRCAQRTNKTMRISNLYFVDVVNQTANVVMRLNNAVESAEKILKEFPEYGITAVESRGHWSDCNECGGGGERFRRVECHLKMTNPDAANASYFGALRLFGSVPCSSTLVPIPLREQLLNHPIVEEFEKCSIECPKQFNDSRIIEELDPTGRKIVVDRLGPNEYRLNERLPPLRQPTQRLVVERIEGDALILDCGGVAESAKWHRDFEPFAARALMTAENADFRIVMTSDNELRFKRLRLEDAGLYSCFLTPDNHLHRTFKLYVHQSEATERWVQWSRSAVRLTALFLLVLLVVTTVRAI